jgi:lipopolysaccharide transport system ATP-binding protein
VSSPAISIEHVSKFYRLGTIGNHTLYQDLNRWWARVRGQPDPLLKIGESDQRDLEREGVWALDDIFLEIKAGDVLGIIGHNGAGKSTLLKILSRITAPTSGQVRVRGRIASLLEVGTGFHPELTGRENIYLNGAILGMSKAEISRKFDEIVAFADVEKFIDTPVKRYSSGMYVRLAFAVAAHLEHEILVVDEVLAVGDIAFQERCLGKMGEISKSGRTVLFVSHNLQSIWSLCPQAIWLDRGKLRAAGPSQEVINDYRDSMLSRGDNSLDNISRVGTGRIRITRIACHSADGQLTPSVPCGAPVTITLSYQADEDVDLRQLEVYLHVSNDRQARLFTLSNAFTRDPLGTDRPGGTLYCTVEELPLVPGEYNIVVSVRLGLEVADKFASPLKLVVTEGAFLADHRSFDRAWGDILIKQHWRPEHGQIRMAEPPHSC